MNKALKLIFTLALASTMGAAALALPGCGSSDAADDETSQADCYGEDLPAVQNADDESGEDAAE